MPSNLTPSGTDNALITRGRGQCYPIDPRMGREPAGSALLARSTAIREAQQSALRRIVADLAIPKNQSNLNGRSRRFDEFVEREIVSKSLDFVQHREVVEESRDEAFYYVTMSVVFDMRAVGHAIMQFNEQTESVDVADNK